MTKETIIMWKTKKLAKLLVVCCTARETYIKIANLPKGSWRLSFAI